MRIVWFDEDVRVHPLGMLANRLRSIFRIPKFLKVNSEIATAPMAGIAVIHQPDAIKVPGVGAVFPPDQILKFVFEIIFPREEPILRPGAPPCRLIGISPSDLVRTSAQERGQIRPLRG